MGYEVYDGPEVEDDYHCFEALNMPPDHPRATCRTPSTSQGAPGCCCAPTPRPAQIRYMLDEPAPAATCGSSARARSTAATDDITHSPMFQQVEGLVVGPGITPGRPEGHDRGLPARALRRRSTRCASARRTSPTPSRRSRSTSAASCAAGKGCRVCKRTGWLEIMGSGMVHPAVFEAVNARLGRVVYDPEEVTGFAFGLGIERVAMVRHGIDDIRLFYENDLRFLEQFARMKVPLSWLREFVDVPVEPRAARPRTSTLAGLAVDGVEAHGDDAVLDLDVTTNRVDCMNVYGVAREVSVLYGVPLRPLDRRRSRRAGAPASEALDVDDRGARPVPALLRARARRARRARRRPGCATAWSRSACGPSTTWSTSPTT